MSTLRSKNPKPPKKIVSDSGSRPGQRSGSKNLRQVPLKPDSVIFISHDSRDSAIADAFAHLLLSVSSGLLTPFCSSTLEPQRGLAYGVEWFTEIEAHLRIASDVICILTERSLERPWILYEAGLARGSGQIPVSGLAIRMPLSRANSGPFSLFHNCADDQASLAKLLRQLLERIPGVQPQEDVIVASVNRFKAKVDEAMGAHSLETVIPGLDSPDAGLLFEAIKEMFYEVSSEISARSLNIYEAEQLVRQASGKPYDPIGLPILASALPSSLSWLQGMAFDLYSRLDKGAVADPGKELKRLKFLLEVSVPLLDINPIRRNVLDYFGRYLHFLSEAGLETFAEVGRKSS